MIALTGVGSGGPAPVDASTWSLAPRCGANLRTKPTSAAVRKVRIGTWTKVTAVATVPGAAYSTSCAGVTRKGSTWYRISAIGGRSVKSLYGVTYLYAATGVFRVLSVSTTLYAQCGSVAVRPTAANTGKAKTTLKLGARVVSNGSVTGAKYTTNCGTPTTSTSWYRITSINGKSVKALYGVTYVYVARPLLATAPPVAATPSPSPSPVPTPSASACVSAFVPTAAAIAPTASSVPTPDPSASAAPSPSATAAPTPTPDPYMQGIDVSDYQSTSIWPAAAAAGKKFAFIKTSEGTGFTASRYAGHRTAANANGIVVGAYHFARPDLIIPHYAADPTICPGAAPVVAGAAEAAYFLSKAKIKVGDLLPAIDMERWGSLSAAQLVTYEKAFSDEVFYQTGLRPIVYVSPSSWSGYLNNSTVAATVGDTLWVAHWTTGSSPLVPASNWAGHGWAFWQFDVGPVAGITGDIDLDRFRYADLAPYLITAITPQPRP
jgi:GH25 family lysozyme M1 (1,4-beta-N-acetylmuramidase)